MKKFFCSVISLTLVIMAVMLTACSNEGVSQIAKPMGIATSDEVHPTHSPDAVTESGNVNGMCYTATLQEFSSRYNNIMMETGGTNYLYTHNWKMQGEPEVDSKGVEYQLYYYNEELFTITAAVETESGCVMNVGCGTSMSNFVTQNKNTANSDIILHACAIMAAAVCGFNNGSLDVLQDIFYQTTFENTDSLWYEGNVFVLTTNKNKSDSSTDTMLFRVFPISDKLKNEWNIVEYEQYIATMPAD